ncbi:hypothetical protein [Kineosporia succinea]|uniref:HNH endonuclease n=1 Tax=Kineosporia succinea TaxID=84632 RepID=A0ABT9P5V9_9ACTN|nr:hypothetical protein [Kineosporia succinea]MDP9828057.1 hypothetical protein [Kineosporia succinea]
MPTKRTRTTGDPALKTYARKQLRAAILIEVKAGRGCEKPRCLMRTRAIAWWLPRTSPWSYDLDEILTRDQGGSPTDPHNVRPAHARCNRSAGAGLTNSKRRARAAAARGPLDVHLDDW